MIDFVPSQGKGHKPVTEADSKLLLVLMIDLPQACGPGVLDSAMDEPVIISIMPIPMISRWSTLVRDTLKGVRNR